MTDVKRIMGVDCSSNSFAFSVFEGDVLKHYGDIRFGKGDIHHRINRAQEQIRAMKPVWGDIDSIYYESAVYIQNKQTVILLSMALGAAIAPVVTDDTLVFPTHPMNWQRTMNPPFTKEQRVKIADKYQDKSASWIKNKTRLLHKEKSIRQVEKLYGVVTTSDDVSDAILIGAWGAKQ